MLERETSPGPVATAGEEDVERRLRALGSSCAVVAAAALVTSGVVGWEAVRASAADWMTSAPGGSFLAAVCGMLLVLLASAAHGRILRRQADLEAAEAADLEGAGEAEDVEAVVAARLRAFSWATGICFGMLAVAAVLGGLAADGGKAPLLGVVVCVAVVFAMRARWPTRGAFASAFPATGQDGGENHAGGRR